jgi:hypothetical protein
MTDLKPIETIYRGYRFRSRLEARWAVFLDAAGVDWQYEAEGFDLGGIYYLPDFWLSVERKFLEIKPEIPGQRYDELLREVSPALNKLATASGCEAFLIITRI